jgi:hypothetical protein
MLCMPLPTKNTPPQIDRPRNAVWRRGLHKEVEGEDMSAGWMGPMKVRWEPAVERAAVHAVDVLRG